MNGKVSASICLSLIFISTLEKHCKLLGGSREGQYLGQPVLCLMCSLQNAF